MNFSGLFLYYTCNNQKQITMKENGFEYVDLGLPSKTMWATCNVGATKPEDQGLLFQFGRVDGYKYNDKNHKFINKDIPETTSGTIYINGETLLPIDDAAHAHMGGKWRMPTNDELEELYKNTTYNVETINGINGMMFTSNINYCQVFIPFAGYWYKESFIALEYNAYVWSSQVLSSHIYNACCLGCSFGYYADVYFNYRTYAFSVRGVFSK